MKNAIDRRIPIIGMSPAFVKAGAVAAFFADYKNNGELAGLIALQVLKGQSPDRLAVMSPSVIQAGFNLPIARRLDQSIDPNALQSASDVVQ